MGGVESKALTTPDRHFCVASRHQDWVVACPPPHRASLYFAGLYHTCLVTCLCPGNFWALMPPNTKPLIVNLSWVPFLTSHFRLKKKFANPRFRSRSFPRGREIFKGRQGVLLLSRASPDPSAMTSTQGALRKLLGWRGRNSCLLTRCHCADR